MKPATCAALLLLVTTSTQSGSRDIQWKKVEEALRRDLPRTAITNLQPIVQSAVQDQAWAEAARAILQLALIESSIQGYNPEVRIRLLEKEITKAPPQLVPILRTALAHWYWDYFRQNRWRFLRRTPTTTPPSDDFTTWDLQRLFTHIDQLFTSALSAHESLKTIPVNQWDDLLEKGTLPDSYRPTLYDFIAHEALEFYTAPEQAVTLPEESYQLPADSPVFDP
ncbi:MAG: hypothetical protein N3G20_04935, partial [Verrucomicrobiae bacterium]|nr:hypothetical protein [Verrucomicrobiae bacterium]